MARLASLKTLPDFLDNSAKLYPNKKALIFENKNYTYTQIQRQANSIAQFLIDRTNQQEVIAVLLDNSPELIFSYFGVLKAGCIVLFLSSNISDASLIFQIKKTRPKIILSCQKYKSKLKRTKVVDQVEYIDVNKITLIRKQVENRKITENDVSTIIFTSGTTSEPKGVKLQHRNAVNATKNIIQFLKFNKNDIDVNISALSHSFGLGHIHCIFAVGGTTILFRDAINLKKIIQTIIRRKAATFGAVPTILRLILNNYFDEFKKCDKYLRFVQTNTSLLEPELINGIFNALPSTDFNYYYGLTEASRSTFITLNKHRNKITSVGKPSPNVELKIVNKQNRKLLPGQIGEICIKGKHVIKEYWENPGASKAIKNSWLHTGDAGYLDKDGYLYFKGRNDDIINVSGEKLSPEEIEDIAKTVPGVQDAGAIGASDRLLGQAVKLFISTKIKKFDLEKVIQECRKKLENYKVPKVIKIIKQIPRTENGKLRRSALKKL